MLARLTRPLCWPARAIGREGHASRSAVAGLCGRWRIAWFAERQVDSAKDWGMPMYRSALKADAIGRATAEYVPGIGGSRALLKLVDDAADDVQLQLACTFGEWNDPDAGSGTRSFAKPTFRSTLSYGRGSQFQSAKKNLLRVLNVALLHPHSTDLISQLFTMAVVAENHQVLNGALLQVFWANGERTHGRIAPWQMTAMTAVITELRRRDTTPDKVLEPDVLGRLLSIVARARELVADDNTAVDVRAVAVGLLGQGTDEKDFEALALLLGPKHPAELQIAAINAIGRSRDARAAERLLSGWQAYSLGSRSLRCWTPC